MLGGGAGRASLGWDLWDGSWGSEGWHLQRGPCLGVRQLEWEVGPHEDKEGGCKVEGGGARGPIHALRVLPQSSSRRPGPQPQ